MVIAEFVGKGREYKMIRKYISWVSAIPLWKKITFYILSFFMSLLFCLFMSLFMGINLIVYTTNIIRLVILMIVKKIAAFFFINKVFYKIAQNESEIPSEFPAERPENITN